MEKSFQWLLDSFGAENIRTRKILTPHYKDFPIRYNGDTQSALDTLTIIANQMEIDPGAIHLELYGDGITGLSNNIALSGYKSAKYSAGMYLGKEEDGKYHIWLEHNQLHHPEKMVATLAHELAHIKLLGEDRIQKNDEALTDFTTIVFGLGIFNANSSFDLRQGYDGWSYSTLGYLKQREWGYALALFSIHRDQSNADWHQFLTKNLRSDIAKSIEYIQTRPA